MRQFAAVTLLALGLTACATSGSGEVAAMSPELMKIGITSADYPAVALRDGEEGKTSVTLEVDETGAVTNCTVTQSSGFSVLDEQTCALARTRLTVKPAEDRQGRPVAGSLTFPMIWRLPMVLRRTSPTAILASATLEPNGRLTDCMLDLEPSQIRPIEDPCSVWTGRYASENMASVLSNLQDRAPLRLTLRKSFAGLGRIERSEPEGLVAEQVVTFQPQDQRCASYENGLHNEVSFTTPPVPCSRVNSLEELRAFIDQGASIIYLTQISADSTGSHQGGAPAGDRFTVINSVNRLADGTITNCRLVDAPSEGACDVWREGDEGPAAFARAYWPGEALTLSLVVDVRPWTGALQPVPVPGTVEQVVLLGGEDQEACARLGEGGAVMRGWSEITACPLTTDAAVFFAKLGDPRPRQSTWTLTAEPLTPSN